MFKFDNLGTTEDIANAIDSPFEEGENVLKPSDDYDDEYFLANKNAIEFYFEEIRKYPLLSAKEELDLAKRMKETKDPVLKKELQNQMVNSNLRLVVSIAKRYTYSKIPLLDIIQEGNMGLMHAVKKFDYKKGFRISTYATPWIHQYIGRCLLSAGTMIRIPAWMSDRMKKLDKAYAKISSDTGREPTMGELCQATGFSVAEIEDIRSYNISCVSLNTPLGEGNEDGELTAFIPDDNIDVEKDVEEEYMAKNLISVISNPSNAKNIFADVSGNHSGELSDMFLMKYGIEPYSRIYTLEEIGDKYGITKEWVRQLLSKAEQCLRQESVRMEYKF